MTKPHTFESDATASANAYANVPITTTGGNARANYLVTTSSGPISVNWKNTGSDTIKVKVLGGNNVSMADADKSEEAAEATIASGAMRHIEIPIAYYQFYWFQHASDVADTPGETTLYGRHSRV